MSNIKHYLFGSDSDSLEAAVLIKDSAFNFQMIQDNYIKNLQSAGIELDALVAFNLKYINDKVTAKVAKEYLLELLEGIDSLGITTLYIADSTYFKYATAAKPSSSYGEVLPCSAKEFTHINCILGVNYRACLYDPKQKGKLTNSLETLTSHLLGSFIKKEIDINIEYYPDNVTDIKDTLNQLLDKPSLACDIETTSLRFDRGVLYSIAFSWANNEGTAFMIEGANSLEIKQALLTFFKSYQGKLIYHNGLYDIKWLIYHLFMDPKVQGA